MVRHAGAAPALCLWKRRVLAVTPMTLCKWWLLPVSRRTPFVFSEVLIYLSYAAVVPPRGIAPRSIGYRPIALLLSYGGMKWSPDVVTLHGLPGVGRLLSF